MEVQMMQAPPSAESAATVDTYLDKAQYDGVITQTCAATEAIQLYGWVTNRVKTVVARSGEVQLLYGFSNLNLSGEGLETGNLYKFNGVYSQPYVRVSADSDGTQVWHYTRHLKLISQGPFPNEIIRTTSTVVMGKDGIERVAFEFIETRCPGAPPT